MGPEYWKPGSPTALKKCSERRSNDCDPTETDRCCAVIPCAYCLEWNPEEGETVYAYADFATNGWTATIAGAAWFGSWQRNYDTDECEFVVTLDDVEIYRKPCYEGQSCRDSSDSTAATIGEVSGIITWTRYEPRPLEYIQDPDTNCTTYFCDECECSCECLCVTISEFISEGVYETHTGEICDVAYSCDPPLWAGTVGPLELSLALGRDEYGRCVIIATVDDQEQAPVLFPGCADAAEVTITLADTSTITVRCKQCDCAEAIGDCICGRPLGPALTLLWSSGNGTHGSALRQVTLTYQQFDEPGITCPPFSPDPFPAYVGSVSGTFPLPMGGEREDTLHIVLVCGCIGCELCLYYYWENGGAAPGYFLTTISETDCNCPAIFDGGAFTDGEVWGYQISDITITEDESNC